MGLRREEVAILAGISTDYYLRLEQGRDRHPSGQVQKALARALRLDSVAAAYLHRLAEPEAASGAADRDDLVHESTQRLIDSWTNTAAMVHSRYNDVLASNALARALNPNFRPGVNSVLSLFTDPSERSFHVGWEALAARSVAQLRNLADTHGEDQKLDALVAEGSRRSASFRRFWQSQDVALIGSGQHLLSHPRVGDLNLFYLALPLVGTDGQSIFLYFAEQGTPSATAMQQLAQEGWEQQGHGGISDQV